MLTLMQVAFLVAALLTLIAALMTVTSPSIVHSALWLILTLGGIAILFVLLNAGFLAVVQVAIYIDAIAIMIIIVVMLTHDPVHRQTHQENKVWWGAAVAAILLLVGLVVIFTQTPSLGIDAPLIARTQETILKDLGQALVDVDQFILPFEIASVLLLAAMIGSIIVAWPKQDTPSGEVER